MKRWKLVILSGLLIGLSFPPLKMGFLAWVALVPFMTALDRSSPGQSLLLGYLGGAAANLVAVHWLSLNVGASFPVVFASMIGAVIYLSLSWAVIGYLFVLLHVNTGKGFFLIPFIWTAVEFVMSFGALGFPWISLATTQVDYAPLVQLSEFTGIYGVTFWVVVVNVMVHRYVNASKPIKGRLMNRGLLVLVVPWLLGYGRMVMVDRHSESETNLTISIVQPNVGPHEKWDPERRDWVFDHLDSLYVEAVSADPQMIVWPESATPAYLSKNHRRLRKVRERITESHIPLLAGTIDWARENGERKFYNGAVLIGQEDSIVTYHKIHLVPLAEYNPLSERFPFSDKLSLGHFTPGNSLTVFRLNKIPFSTVICYESAFPQLVRAFVESGAQFLVIVVNDGWYGNTAEPYQHAALARFRAVEHRMPVVRCANTGISAFYDAEGRTIASLGVGEEGIITAGISPRRVLTFYSRFGDVFAKLCLAMTLILGGWFWLRAK